MLPGFRILFAIVLLSVSVLIFGLGAAAFLRSAHENIASAPLWRPIEPPATARVDLTQPTLAMLRVEPDPLPVTPSPKSEPAPVMPAESAAPRAPTVSVDAAGTPPAESKPAVAAAPSIVETPAQTAAASPARDTAATMPPPAVQEPAREAAASPATVDAKEAPAAPMVVAAIGPEKIETATPEADTAKAVEAATATVAPTQAAPATTATSDKAMSVSVDTLKPDDKALDATPSKIAALGEPAAYQSFADATPLPAHEVKIPQPRIDPAVREANRRQLLTQQRTRARAVQARRAAIARAHAAAQARASAAAGNPFATPASQIGFPGN